MFRINVPIMLDYVLVLLSLLILVQSHMAYGYWHISLMKEEDQLVIVMMMWWHTPAVTHQVW